MKQESNYNYFIDFIKFIFSIIIVLYHAWIFADNYWSGLFLHGNLAVGFYFIVTGYLMLQSLDKEKKNKDKIGIRTLRFLYKKIAGIFPYILFSFIIGTIIIYGKDILSLSLLTDNNMAAELFQFGILGFRYTINSATWYISAMMMSLAVLYPLALKFKDNYNTLISPLLLILFLGICYTFNIDVDAPLNMSLFCLNGLYKAFIFTLLGNIAYSITNLLKKLNLNKLGKAIFTFIEFGLIVCLVFTMQFNFIGTIMFALMTVFLVIITFSGKSFSKNIFCSPIYKKLGKFGFVMYLNNIYFRDAIINSGLNLRYRYSVILYIGLTVAVSLLSYYLVPILVKLCKNILICLKRKIIS